MLEFIKASLVGAEVICLIEKPFQVTPEAPVSVDALGEIVKTKQSCWRTFCALVYIRTVRMIRDPYKLYVMIFMPISKCYHPTPKAVQRLKKSVAKKAILVFFLNLETPIISQNGHYLLL